MKKIRNLVIGGIESKVATLLLLSMFVVAAVFSAFMFTQNKMLSGLTEETSKRQLSAVTGTTSDVIHTVIEDSMERDVELQARLTDAMFHDRAVGILELSTGKLTCSNAGHEYPAFKQPDGKFELYKDKHGFVLGGLEEVRYREYEIRLEPGAKLFVYTDGVPESSNAEKELFGTDRMIEALNTDPNASCEDVLKNVRDSVDQFVSSAEQFDDLTMLCLEYKGPKADGNI